MHLKNIYYNRNQRETEDKENKRKKKEERREERKGQKEQTGVLFWLFNGCPAAAHSKQSVKFNARKIPL